MVNDIQCPYCAEWNEINHDDEYGYSEDVMHGQECCDCGKTFGFTTELSLSYTPHIVDCLNSGIHDYKPTFTVPVEHTKMECACGAARNPSPEELKEVMKSREGRYQRLVMLRRVSQEK